MAHKSFRKSQLVEFKNTAAGHEGVLSDPSGSFIIKPCKQSEIDFYQSTTHHPNFCRFIPTFIGQLSLLDQDPAQAAAALMQSIDTNGPVNMHAGISKGIAIDTAWTPSNGGKITTDCAIAMENVAHGYKKPNILDVKLGARLWADDAPPAKRAKLDKVAGETTSESLGFRVAGMRTWQGPDAAGQEGVNEDLYKFYDKGYGRALSSATVVDGFKDYFRITNNSRPTKNTRKVIRRFIRDLEDLQEIIENEESRMYSASLLFVYEGDPDVLEEAFVTEKDILDSRSADGVNGNTATPANADRVNGNTATPANTDGVNGNTAPPANTDGVNGNTAPPANIDGSVASATDSEPASSEDEAVLLKLPKIQVLKLIDFAHAKWTPDQGPDENLLHGIRNVIKTLHELI